MAGLSVPAGNFVPAMFMGAVLGRLFKQSLNIVFWGQPDTENKAFAERGMYAMCGSAAVLAGFTHMTVAIVALLTEAWGDVKVAKDLMLSACIALMVKKYFAPHD